MQAALTATIQANIVTERSSLAVLSMGMSSTFYVSVQTLADTCPTFARKLNVALSGGSMRGGSVAPRLELCKKWFIRYNGVFVHRSLLFAACKYVESTRLPISTSCGWSASSARR